MGFFRVGPFKISKRGVRVGIGPRIARVHVGTYGRPGISTGVGPFYGYESIGKSRRRRHGTDHAAHAVKLQRRCGYCGAGPGGWCVTSNGGPASKLHAAR